MRNEANPLLVTHTLFVSPKLLLSSIAPFAKRALFFWGRFQISTFHVFNRLTAFFARNTTFHWGKKKSRVKNYTVRFPLICQLSGSNEKFLISGLLLSSIFCSDIIKLKPKTTSRKMARAAKKNKNRQIPSIPKNNLEHLNYTLER